MKIVQYSKIIITSFVKVKEKAQLNQLRDGMKNWHPKVKQG
jgi:hypothetical protein